MTKVEINDFIERGWETGADLFYENHIYHFQCDYNGKKNAFTLNVFLFKANKNGRFFSAVVNKDSEYIDYQELICQNFPTREAAKQFCFSAPIFGGNNFWKVIDKLDWLEDGQEDVVI